MTWTVHFDGDDRLVKVKRTHEVKEDAFKAACALRKLVSNIRIEGPSDTDRYDEEEIADWCRKHDL
jgi:hypothetical protein